MEVYARRGITAATKRAVIARDGMACRCWCARPVVRRATLRESLPDELHFDHVVHWAAGGPDTADNLVVACRDCNLRRPKPATIVRQSKIKVESVGGGKYLWPEGYTPPNVCEPGAHTWGLHILAVEFGVPIVTAIQDIVSGWWQAPAIRDIRVVPPPALLDAYRQRKSEQRLNRRFKAAPHLEPDPGRVEYWRQAIAEGRRLRQQGDADSA